METKMRIIQTPARFYPYIGGVEKYVIDLSSELVKQGHIIKVVCANEPESKVKTIKGIKIERLAYFGKIANTNLTWGLPFKLFKEDFDLIHTHMPTPWSSDVSALICLIKKKPLVLTYHNDLIKVGFSKYIGQLYSSTFLKLLLKKADKIIITQPDYLRNSKYLKKFKNKILIIPNALNLKNFKIKNIKRQRNSLLFLSVLDKHHRYKGLEFLLEAIKIVKKEIPDIFLYVGGKCELLSEYQALSNKLGIEKNVKFLGYLSDNDLHNYYQKCESFILPSIDHAEGFGIVLLEAMAFKTPVIATSMVGIAEDIKKNNSGIIVPPKNSKALADAIIKVLKSSQLAKKMGKNGRRLVGKKYDWKKVAKDMKNIYLEVLGR